MEMEFKNQNMSSGRDNLFFDVALFVIEQQEASVDLLKEKFDITDERAENILKELETEGIVSELLDNNTRDTLMSEEEFSLIYNYKKQNHQIPEPVTPEASMLEPAISEPSMPAPVVKKQTSKKVKKQKNAEKSQTDFEIPLLLKLIILLFIFIAVFFTARRFFSIWPEINILKKRTGWVQNGNKWNYYDYNGKKQINCLVDDGGKYYYFDINGTLAEERWVDFEGKTFYVGKDGAMLKNQWIGDFYVGNDGNVLRNTTTPDGYKVGSDGRYIAETKPVQPQTIIIRETSPIIIAPVETTIVETSNVESTTVVASIKNIANSEYGTNIIEPTAGTHVKSYALENENTSSDKASNLKIKKNENYNLRDYLSNERACSINIIVPTLSDRNGNECIEFTEAMLQERENIMTELFEMADEYIEEIVEEDEDDEYTSYRYITSISFTEPRIKVQDDYSIEILETGKCKWNKGNSSKVSLTLEFDKTDNILSYNIEE